MVRVIKKDRVSNQDGPLGLQTFLNHVRKHVPYVRGFRQLDAGVGLPRRTCFELISENGAGYVRLIYSDGSRAAAFAVETEVCDLERLRAVALDLNERYKEADDSARD